MTGQEKTEGLGRNKKYSKEIIPLCYKELNLLIVNLQYLFSQHNKH